MLEDQVVPKMLKEFLTPDVHGCSYNTFLNYKTHSFNGTEGVVRPSRWFKKMEQWNGTVNTLELTNVETLMRIFCLRISANSLAGATHYLISENISSLAVAK
nr:hypothetical protein [Tanacetum cinerariifolium]